MVEYLLDKGTDTTILNKDGMTPFHIACKLAMMNIVRIFVSKGADINIRTDKDYTPLQIAVFKGYTGMVKYLVSHGADPFLENVYGTSTYDKADDELKQYFERNKLDRCPSYNEIE